MIKPLSYAEILPKLRILKSKLLTPDKARELLSTSTIEDALAVLRDTMYAVASEARSVEGATVALVNLFFSIARGLEAHAPSDAKQFIKAFMGDEELRDALIALQRAYLGKPGVYELPTYRVEGSLLRRIAQDPEAIANPHRFVEAAQDTWARSFILRVSELYNEAKEARVVSWYHLPSSIKLYASAMEKLDSVSRRNVERILCPMIHYRIASALLQAKASNFDARILDRVMEGLKACGVNWAQLRLVYEREPSPQDLAVSLRDLLRRVRLEGKDYIEALESARRSYRVESKMSALAAYASYPYNPALVVAALMLVKLDIEDVKTALTSISLRLKPDEYAVLTVFER